MTGETSRGETRQEQASKVEETFREQSVLASNGYDSRHMLAYCICLSSLLHRSSLKR